jgi:hypothetical protein
VWSHLGSLLFFLLLLNCIIIIIFGGGRGWGVPKVLGLGISSIFHNYLFFMLLIINLTRSFEIEIFVQSLFWEQGVT